MLFWFQETLVFSLSGTSMKMCPLPEEGLIILSCTPHSPELPFFRSKYLPCFPEPSPPNFLRLASLFRPSMKRPFPHVSRSSTSCFLGIWSYLSPQFPFGKISTICSFPLPCFVFFFPKCPPYLFFPLSKNNSDARSLHFPPGGTIRARSPLLLLSWGWCLSFQFLIYSKAAPLYPLLEVLQFLLFSGWGFCGWLWLVGLVFF